MERRIFVVRAPHLTGTRLLFFCTSGNQGRRRNGRNDNVFVVFTLFQSPGKFAFLINLSERNYTIVHSGKGGAAVPLCEIKAVFTAYLVILSAIFIAPRVPARTLRRRNISVIIELRIAV